MSSLTFEILNQDRTTGARRGRVSTVHGQFDTPAFMPVGTQASIKGLLPEMVAGMNSQIILANTYHLMLRPGSELVAEMGGLHQWMRWNGPILTDSGGFQVFSLADVNRIDDHGVTFKSHLDGRTIELTPERSIEVQNQLGADIIMAFDDCPPALEGGVDNVGGVVEDGATSDNSLCIKGGDAGVADGGGSAENGFVGNGRRRHTVSESEYRARVQEACDRSNRWLGQCVKAHKRKQDQALFGIVQGGTDLDQRSGCVQAVCQHDLPGYAIGGVAVGEGYEQLKRVVEHTGPLLPSDRPRYLMGVGYERDILTAVQAGVDMFDCVLPTRNGRNANVFTPTGQMRLRNAKFATDTRVIDEGCDCPACSGGFSRSYLRHLFQAGEMLGPILASAHNIRHFQRLLLDIRAAIADNDWSLIARRWPVAIA